MPELVQYYQKTQVHDRSGKIQQQSPKYGKRGKVTARPQLYAVSFSVFARFDVKLLSIRYFLMYML